MKRSHRSAPPSLRKCINIFSGKQGKVAWKGASAELPSGGGVGSTMRLSSASGQRLYKHLGSRSILSLNKNTQGDSWGSCVHVRLQSTGSVVLQEVSNFRCNAFTSSPHPPLLQLQLRSSASFSQSEQQLQHGDPKGSLAASRSSPMLQSGL